MYKNNSKNKPDNKKKDIQLTKQLGTQPYSKPIQRQIKPRCENKTSVNYNYFCPLQDDEKMPLLSEDKTATPPKGLMKKFRPNEITVVPDEQNEPEAEDRDKIDEKGETWIPVGKSKQKSKKHLEPIAPAYAPKTLSTDNGVRRTSDAKTAKVIPTLIIIKPKRQVIYDLGKILHALLLGLQENNPEVSFGPMNLNDTAIPRINNVDDIPTDVISLHKYAKNPRKTNWGTFVARIMIHSDEDLHQIRLKNSTLRTWLNDEKISIEYNNLTT